LYKLKLPEIKRRGGRALLKLHNNSLSSALQTAYSQSNKWMPWELNKVPSSYWKDMQNQKAYFDWLGEQLNVKHPEDWYKVVVSQVHAKCGAGVLRLYFIRLINIHSL
jgi:hypothetical protein